MLKESRLSADTDRCLQVKRQIILSISLIGFVGLGAQEGVQSGMIGCLCITVEE